MVVEWTGCSAAPARPHRDLRQADLAASPCARRQLHRADGAVTARYGEVTAPSRSPSVRSPPRRRLPFHSSCSPRRRWVGLLHARAMASSEQSGERPALGDLTNSIITNGHPVPSSSQTTLVDPKERRKQKDREKYARMDINKKEEFLKKRREVHQKRKVGATRVNQNQHSTGMVQDNEEETGQNVPTKALDEDSQGLHRGDTNHVYSQQQKCIMSDAVGTKCRNVDGPCTDHEGAITFDCYGKIVQSLRGRPHFALQLVPSKFNQ
ncbi:hypothetical protein BS78_01G120900 [Paspalum vaginatum]|nr:hypothetical protein BS78_01G120900 [Paspalum vaginatum]